MMKNFVVVAAAVRNRRSHSSNRPKISVSQISKHTSYYTAVGNRLTSSGPLVGHVIDR